MSKVPNVSNERVREFTKALFEADDEFAKKLVLLYDQFTDCVPEDLKTIFQEAVDAGASPKEIDTMKASIMFNALEFYASGQGSEHVHGDSCEHDPN